MPQVGIWGSSWNQMIASTTDPTSFRDLVESNDPTTRSHQIPPDPTISHHIPPYPTNIMRLEVKECFKNVFMRLSAKKCGYAS
jgi:hypothetical protein